MRILMRVVWRQLRPLLEYHLEERVLRLPIEAKLRLQHRLALDDPHLIDEVVSELRERILRFLASWEP